MVHIISLDKEHAKDKDTTEEIEQKLRQRIATQRDIGRATARFKKKVFKPILNFTTQQIKEKLNAPRKA